MSIVIIGAGLAGLTCAATLQKQGRSCLVLEADERVGGRIKTDSKDGFLLDHGFQVLLTAYPEARKWWDYDRLELGEFQAGAMVRFQGRFHPLVDPWRRPSQILQTALSPLGSMLDKIRVGKLRHHVCRGSLESLEQNEEMSTRQYLKQAGFSDHFIQTFFRPFLGGIFLEQDLETTSRKFEFVFRMFSEGQAALPAAGMQALPLQLAETLIDGTVQTGRPVKRLKVDSHQVVVEAEGGQQWEADEVVLACGLSTTASLLGKELPTHSFQGTTCLYYSSSEAPVHQPLLYLNGETAERDSDGAHNLHGPINNLCVPNLVQPTYAPPGRSLISISIVDPRYAAMPIEELDQAVRRQATEWFGESVSDWNRLAHFGIPRALPAQRPGESWKPYFSNLPDRIRLSGDYLENASIQGALQSGTRTAEAILAGGRVSV